MAYVVVNAKDGRELTRRPLEGRVTIGRDPANSMQIRDILLSRKHCLLEPEGDRWVLVDLNSRNGTFVNFERISRCPLTDGDRILIGRTVISFHIREFATAERERLAQAAVIDQKVNEPATDRPVDPFEALSGTVADFKFESEFAPLIERPIARQVPTPRPVRTQGYPPPLAGEDLDNPILDSSPTWATKKIAAATSRMRMELDRFEATVNPAPTPPQGARGSQPAAAVPSPPAPRGYSWRLIAQALLATFVVVLLLVAIKLLIF